jgi:hypothetical protein
MSKLSQEYEKDFYAWTVHNTQLMRAGKLSEIDVEHIAEELESMGKSNKRELINRLAVLIAHLLKWQFQSGRRSKSWMLTIKNQRFEIEDLLSDSPSLKSEIAGQFEHAYQKALLLAAEQTGIDEKDFPSKCPFTLKQCLDAKFFPQ